MATKRRKKSSTAGLTKTQKAAVSRATKAIAAAKKALAKQPARKTAKRKTTKRKTSGRKKRRSPAQIAAAKRNLKKARRKR